MIILVGGEKGGTGKTTLAINFAVTRHKEKGNLLLVDADPQPNSTYWCYKRDELNVKPRIDSVQKTGKGVRHEIAALNEKYSDIVIDSGGRDSPELRGSMLAAHIAVIPVAPGQFDLWGLTKLDDLVSEVKIVNPTLRVLVVITRASSHDSDKELKEVRQYIAEAEFENLGVAKNVIKERKAYKQMAKQGKSIFELEMDSKAETEFNELYKEILNGY
jgi:chromosome partitioning protein